jgi:hypothetical protein
MNSTSPNGTSADLLELSYYRLACLLSSSAASVAARARRRGPCRILNVHSLCRLGCLYYDAIPNMPAPTLRALIERFQTLLMEIKVTAAAFTVI